MVTKRLSSYARMRRRSRGATGQLLLGLAGLALALGWPGRADARMYQWVNSQTGRSQLSGSPPPWYRSVRPGPRVLVYDRGILIDDTSLPLSEAHSEALRRGAFKEAAQRRELLALQRLEETARREAAKAERAASAAESARSRRSGPGEEEPAQSAGPLERFGADTIDRLKAIISEFDRLGAERPGGRAAQEISPGSNRTAN